MGKVTIMVSIRLNCLVSIHLTMYPILEKILVGISLYKGDAKIDFKLPNMEREAFRIGINNLPDRGVVIAGTIIDRNFSCIMILQTDFPHRLTIFYFWNFN